MGNTTTGGGSHAGPMEGRRSEESAGGVAAISSSLDNIGTFVSGDRADPQEIDEHLKRRADRKDITAKQGKRFQERKERIEEKIEEDLAVQETIAFGSAVKGTMTGPVDENSDIDFMIVLDHEEHKAWAEDPDGGKKALKAVKRRLQSRLQVDNDKISVQRNVVQVEYSDMTVEVAPAFYYGAVREAENPGPGTTPSGLPYFTSNDPRDGYVIPDTYGGSTWVGTDPREDKKMLDAVDQRHGGNVRRMVREVKDYHDRHNTGVSSYHAELMVRKYFREEAAGSESYRTALRHFLRKHPEYLNDEVREPVYGERIDRRLNRRDKEKALRKARKTKELARESENLEREGRIEESKERMSEGLDEV